MSLSTRVTEQAQAVAKRAGHSELVPLHVLIALLERSDVDPPLLLAATQRLDDLKQPHSTSGAMAVTAAADAFLKRCTSVSDCDVVEQELSESLLGDVPQGEARQSRVDVATQVTQPDGPTVEDCLAELDALIGMSDVKAQVRRLLAVHKANAARAESGLPTVPVSLHLVFTGSPGTGKTSVARVIAKIYRATGLLPEGQLVEVDRGEMVAGFVGQTALKVREAFDRANGGVLFIDEAYALAQDAGAGFGDEAIAALVKTMEDRRESTAVIVAGYKEPMKAFISANSGLKSRFPRVIEFPDYSAGELHAIFMAFAAQHSIGVTAPVSDAVLAHLSSAETKSDAGNARYVRNMFEAMFANMSVRAEEDGAILPEEVREFQPQDVPHVTSRSAPALGFA